MALIRSAAEIARIERQHLLDRRERGVDVLALASHHGEVEPGRDTGRVEAHGLAERRFRARQVAGRHRTQRGLVATGGGLFRRRRVYCGSRLFHAVRLSPRRPPPQGFAPCVTLGNNAPRGVDMSSKTGQSEHAAAPRPPNRTRATSAN